MFARIQAIARGFNRLFWVTVIIPTTLASIYFGLIASDVFISQSKFVIYNPQSPSPTAGGLGTLLAGSVFSNGTYGVYAAQNYLQSRDALAQLQRSLNVEAMYSGRHADWVNRFGGLIYFRKTFEELYQYYGHMVGIDVDPTSNITTLTTDAYTPDDAQKINAQLLAQAQQLVDRLNAGANAEGVKFYANEVVKDESQVQAAAMAIAHYRNAHRLFAPAPQSAIELQFIAKLQDHLLQQESTLAQMMVNTPLSPQLPMLKRAIAATRTQIDAQQARVAGAPNSLASESVEYERLTLNQSFTEKRLAAAITALEDARIQAQKQQLFIETVVAPNKPDQALQPRRFRGVLATLIVGLLVWGVLSVVVGGIKEHHDR